MPKLSDDLLQSFIGMGLSESAARIAAEGHNPDAEDARLTPARETVAAEISPEEIELREAFRQFGLSERGARIAAAGRR
jgi:hypothetical protein